MEESEGLSFPTNGGGERKYDTHAMSDEERDEFAQKLVRREDVVAIAPTDSFMTLGGVERLGTRDGELGVEVAYAVMLMLYDADSDLPVLVLIPHGMGKGLAEDIIELEGDLDARFGEHSHDEHDEDEGDE